MKARIVVQASCNATLDFIWMKLIGLANLDDRRSARQEANKDLQQKRVRRAFPTAAFVILRTQSETTHWCLGKRSNNGVRNHAESVTHAVAGSRGASSPKRVPIARRGLGP